MKEFALMLSKTNTGISTISAWEEDVYKSLNCVVALAPHFLIRFIGFSYSCHALACWIFELGGWMQIQRFPCHILCKF